LSSHIDHRAPAAAGTGHRTHETKNEPARRPPRRTDGLCHTPMGLLGPLTNPISGFAVAS
jgi:hypothetical protein